MAAEVLDQELDAGQFRGYPVELPTFQGPLDLLLHLIKRDKIEIWEISIQRITRQYLDYLNSLRELNIEVAGEFLVMAATLMRIKSQNLLPRPSFLPEDGDEDVPLTRDELIRRLIEYRKYREAATALSRLEGDQARRHGRASAVTLDAGHQLPLREPKLIDLAEYLTDLLSRRDPMPGHQVHLEEIKLDDQIDWVLRLLGEDEPYEAVPGEEEKGIRFGRLLRTAGFRLEVVVTLLAILELARLQRLTVWQKQVLDEIWIFRRIPEAVPAFPETGTEPTAGSEEGAGEAGPVSGPDAAPEGAEEGCEGTPGLKDTGVPEGTESPDRSAWGADPEDEYETGLEDMSMEDLLAAEPKDTVDHGGAVE